MFTRTLTVALMSAVVLVLVTTCPLYAIPTQVVHANDPLLCDFLFIPQDVDEIGTLPPFPMDERLSSVSTQTSLSACPLFDDPAADNALVFMTNLTGRDLHEVWYIANNETRISNIDGFANDIGFLVDLNNETFRIDNDISDPGGAHHPLIGEDMTPDGIWEAGETWEFILQDYGNALGLPAEAFRSVGVGDTSMGMGTIVSSGSIIAIPIPEPGSAMLALLAMSAWGFISRRKRTAGKITN